MQLPDDAGRRHPAVAALERGHVAEAAYAEYGAGQQIKSLLEVDHEFQAGEGELRGRTRRNALVSAGRNSE
jgi:hypothetical protein